MILDAKENNALVGILNDLSHNFGQAEIRNRVGHGLLELLDADYFASYIWDPKTSKFDSCIQLNMTDSNIRNYEDYYQFRDPITPTLKQRRKATTVSEVMSHDRLSKTEFFNDFLAEDGLCYGINYYAYSFGENIGDLRVWRNRKKSDFGQKEKMLLDAIGTGFTNALNRCLATDNYLHYLTFNLIRERYGLTEREVQISDLIFHGKSDQEICDQLMIAKPTLRTHVSSIFSKLKISRRTQLAPLLLSVSAS